MEHYLKKIYMDVRGPRIVPRFKKLRADGDTGIAREIVDPWENTYTGLLLIWGRADAEQESNKTGGSLLPW